jgi:hypothetical protein
VVTTGSGGETTYLVGRFGKVLGIKRGSQAEGDTGTEEDVVCQSGDTTVVDLGL